MHNAAKASDDLGRHQRVLDAYLAHAGSDALPPPGLDAKLIALATSSLKTSTQAQQQGGTDVAASDSSGISTIKTSARSRRRHWPFALAASVATIGFAAILARNGLLETPGYSEPSYSAGSYEAKSVAQEQAAIDATAAVAADVASDAAAAASESPDAVLEEAKPVESRAQVAASAPSDDKAKQSATADMAFERAEPALGRSAATEQDSEAKAFAPPPAEVTAPILAAAPEPVLDASPRPTPMAAPAEAAEMAATAIDSRRRADLEIAAPVQADGAVATGSAPASPAKANADNGTVALEQIPEQIEPPQAQAPQATSGELAASAPLDEITVSTNAKKDESAAEAQAGLSNPHAKTYATIRALRDGGEMQKAQSMLARFRKAYPLVVLPDDLVALAKAK